MDSARIGKPIAETDRVRVTWRAMYGRISTSLEFLVGDEITQVAYGWYDVQFHFADGANVSVWSEVHHTVGGATDVWKAGSLPDSAGLLSVLGNASGRPPNPVVRVVPEESGDLVIEFARGDELRLREDPDHEAYSISTKETLIVV